MKENIDSNFTELPQLNQRFLVKGMHLMKKMKEVKESDRRQVLSELENVQRSIPIDKSVESRANIIENAWNIVDRHKRTLAIGCGRGKSGPQHLSSLERNRIALGLLK